MEKPWMVRRDDSMDSYTDDEGEAREMLREAREDAQDEINEGIFEQDEREFATLYRFDPLPRSVLRKDAGVLPGDLAVRVKVASVQLREWGHAGDGSKAGAKAEARGLDFWAEAVIVEHL